MSTGIHHGHNIRCIRLLQGMKQKLFACQMGISQQRVSKLEQQRRIPAEILQAAAKAMNVSVAAIENFNEKSVVNNAGHSLKAIKERYSAELAKKDKQIQALQAELSKYITISRSVNDLPDK